MLRALAALQGGCQRISLPSEPILPLALALLGNFLRIHLPGPVTDGLFCLLILLLGLLLFRDGAFGQFAPARRGAARCGGVSLAAARCTCWCFAALIALYAIGLAFEFSLKGFRHLAGLLIGALLFLFCYWNGPALVRSKAAALLFLGAVAALLLLYLRPVGLNPNGFSLILGYSLLTIALVLIARSEQPRRQQLWACIGLALMVVCGVVYGNRSLAITALLGCLVYWGGGFLLRDWRGVGVLALAAGALIALTVALLGTSRFADLRSNLENFSRNYTGSGLQSGREVFFQIALAGIARAPWFGNGPGAEITLLSPQGGSTPVDLETGDAFSCFDSGNAALVADCALLLKLRNDLAGDSERLWTWNFHTPIDRWQGIKLAGKPVRVAEIDLSHNSLTGRIPPEIGGLDQLISLRLSVNMLVGAIPPELGQLTNLRTLALDANALSGTIPPELAELSNLTELRLNNNRLSGAVPVALADLGNLSFIRLANNDFVGALPPALQQSDQYLFWVPRCQHSSQIGPGLLADCTRLLAARDALAGDGVLNWSPAIPIANWQGVKLQGAPPRVVGLELVGAGLSGRIPPQLGELDQLVFLRLQDNQLTGVMPPELGSLERLEELRLDGNRLTGPIPSALSNFPKLKLLRLNGNEFAGPMPPVLRAVDDHDLDVNLFCLPLPQVNAGLLRDCATLLKARDELAGAAFLNWMRHTPIAFWQGVDLGGDPVRVVGLKLQWAGLTGQVPPALGELERLHSLRLSGNRLAGHIPLQLGKLADLQVLELNENVLAGAIPPELGNLSQLKVLRLEGNRLRDGPSALCQASEIFFDDGYCLPSLRVNPRLLRDSFSLLAARDVLAGSAKLNWSHAIPIESWQGVQVGGEPRRVIGLVLDNQPLDGMLPPELGRLSGLVRLSIQGTRIAGAIPRELGELANLEELRLDGNRLSGDVPAALQALGKLEILRLAGNRLGESVPSALREVKNHDLNEELFCLPSPWVAPDFLEDCALLLEIRDLLGGKAVKLNWRRSLPLGRWQGVELGGASARVAGLVLPALGLSGSIPSQLGGLAKLRRLVLESNALTGAIPPELGDLEELEELRLRNNRLSGAVPEALAKLPRLSLLRLAGNRFAEPMPLALRELADQDLDEELRCPLVSPANPGLMDDCVRLLTMRDALGDPDWSNAVPIESWPWVELGGEPPRVASLALENWRGEAGNLRIPPPLGNLAGLQTLSLQGHAWGGSIPPELGKLKNLRQFILRHTAVHGPIPPELGKLENLAVLRLGHNKLTGAIPEELGASGALRFLELRGNRFDDCAPSLALLEVASNDFHQALLCLPLPASEIGLAQDAEALLAAKDDLAGDAELNWNEQTPIPLWQGLRLGFPGGHPRVIGLELPEMGLNGRILPELGALDRLVSLQLSGNRLTGAVPLAVGRLPRLTLVRLSGNPDLGAIPAKLRLVDDQDLGAGPFCRTDARIGPGLLRDCQRLLAARDVLAGSAFQLNWRRAAPVAFWRGVTLGGAPARVVALDLSRLGLNGAIPSELGGLEQLVSLRLHRNALAGPIPSSLGELANLQELALNGNVLTGAIPPQLGNLSQLRSLHLRRNRLNGPIPGSLGKLAALRVLTLDGNALAGAVPPQLGNLEELRLGNPPSNGAPGAAPAPANPSPLEGLQGGDAPVLASPLGSDGNGLALERDSQGAALEADLFCRPALQEAHGPLHGDCRILLSIREELAGDAQLNWREEEAIQFWQGVSLAGNPLRIAGLELPQMGLNGRLPKHLARLDQLAALRLNGNQLAGPIPQELGQLPNLRSLALGGNQFAGCLPKPLRKTGDRELELDLLCGPSPWSKPALLEDAALLMGIRDALAGGASLNWSYDTPIWQWQGVALDVGRERVIALDLSGMGLQGRIPPALGALDGLLRLRLSDNQLVGALPSQLGNLFRLQELALDGNALTGPIPEELGNLPELSKLWLAGNQIVGPLPRKLCHLEQFLRPLSVASPCWGQPVRGIGDAVKRLNLFLNPMPEEGIARTTHNLFLQMGLQTGIVGIALAALLCASLFFNLRSRWGGEATLAQRFLAACVFQVVVHGAFEVFLLQGATRVGALAWMLIGMGTGALCSGQLSQWRPAERSAAQQ